MRPASHGATLADLLAVADEKPYYELLGGELEQKVPPLFRHGRLQRILGAQLGKHFGDEAEPGEPGGWWIGSEVHVQLAPDVVVVPDHVGWRMNRVPELPDSFPVTIRPDWVCEILSPTNPARDTIRKLRVYHEVGIPHYWIADPERKHAGGMSQSGAVDLARPEGNAGPRSRVQSWQQMHRGWILALFVAWLGAACPRARSSTPPSLAGSVRREPIGSTPVERAAVEREPVEGAGEPGPDPDESERTWSSEHDSIDIQKFLAAHPEAIPSVIGSEGLVLVLVRRVDGASLCVADRDELAAARCYRIAGQVEGAHLLVEAADAEVEPPRTRRAWVAVGGDLFRVGEDGALLPEAGVRRGYWRGVGRARDERVKRTRRRALAWGEEPVGALPLAALVAIGPREATGGPEPVLVAEELMCVRVEARWRCVEQEWLEGVRDARVKALAPVRGSALAVVPVEVSRCDGGSELSECARVLHVLAVEGEGLRPAGSLPLGAEVDEHLRELDDDSMGARVVGTREEYRWRHVFEAPLCVRMVRAERTAEKYDLHFRDDRVEPRGRRRVGSVPARYGPAPAELPRWTPEVDPHAEPPDLRGLWQLRGERWVRVSRCAP